MASLKVISLLGLLAAYFGVFVFGPAYSRLDWQTGLLFLLLGLHIQKHGFRTTSHVLGMILPFVAWLFVFGAVFQWIRLLGRADWLMDSLCKAVVFPNSFLAVKLGLGAVTFADILRLPLRGGLRTNVIITKAVMDKCAPLLQRYRTFMDLSPHFNNRRGRRLYKICALIVAAYVSIYQQTEKTQALYQHRIQHIRKEKK